MEKANDGGRKRKMSRRSAIITQADVARVIRAAKQAGASAVEVRPDGKILVLMHEPEAKESTEPLSNGGGIVL